MRSRRAVLSSLVAGLATVAGCNADSDSTTTTTDTTATTTRTTTSTTTTTAEEVSACDADWNPTTAWSVDGDSVGAPYVTDDRVYVPVDGELRALAAEDAGVEWRTPLDGGYVWAAADGVVVADDDGLTALDAASGDRLWSFSPPGDTGSRTYAVAVHDGTAYVPATQYRTPSTDPDVVYGRLYRFDVASGDRLGVHDITGDDRDWLQPLAALADDTGVYVTFDAGGVLGASHDGTVEWRREGDDWYYTPVLAGDVLVQPQSRQVTALDPATGETVWTDDRLDMQVAAADGVVYGTSGGSPQTYATFAAVDAATGDAEWTSKLDGCGSTIVAGDGVVATAVTCRQNRVDLYDVATGCRYGGVDGGPDSNSALALGDDTLYATRYGGTDELAALSLPESIRTREN
jgi:outer membrane protein assembly factor BamB